MNVWRQVDAAGGGAPGRVGGFLIAALVAGVLAMPAPSLAAPPRETVVTGKLKLPFAGLPQRSLSGEPGGAADPSSFATAVELWVPAVLDLAPFKDLIASRYSASATVTDFKQGKPFKIARPEAPGAGPIHGRDFTVSLRLIIDSATARMALKVGETYDVTFSGRLIAGALEGDGGCGEGARGLALALLVFDAPQRVGDEFAGFTGRLCLHQTQQRQCIVNTLDDGRVVERCYPDTPAAEFDRVVCNRAYLDKKRAMLTSKGGVSCHHLWREWDARFSFDLLPGNRPSSFYKGFIRGGLRPYGAVVMRQIAARYRALWRERFEPSHGAMVR